MEYAVEIGAGVDDEVDEFTQVIQTTIHDTIQHNMTELIDILAEFKMKPMKIISTHFSS